MCYDIIVYVYVRLLADTSIHLLANCVHGINSDVQTVTNIPEVHVTNIHKRLYLLQ